ncbi:hypothetical protein TRM7557_01311 [Tritonibacter multivorans]|uniref:Uncharacterized protein n=1 Tax=Tritonibacter multivorans TaxID=928856 RepID=A0A0P1GNL2_9RHOB|nr:hypothetical protein [Tritonibacter multivorans]MDA7422805.1 hypothetical protein [Tritonibacter multivorans]CUH77311.1 hypothetical protein TRM7557_01311 [Tritonibacter multivorans]SFD59297.1 hypothetical protein SAMN04488049_11724 [Tritonibacter multivorans]
MAFVGLTFGTIFGLATAVLAYTLLGVPLFFCFLIYAFSGAAFTMLTILGLYARGGHWDAPTDIDAEFDRQMSREGRARKSDFHIDVA